MSGAIVVEGRGLHGGAHARVTIRALDDERAESTLGGAPLGEWRAVPAERSTMVARGESRVRTVEHLCAALAARGLRRGVGVAIEGAEVPILDGCAAAWLGALAPLAVAPSPAWIVVARDEVIEVATSRYVFARGEGTQVVAEIDLGDPRIAREASWDGDARDFAERIARARTFCFASEVEELGRRGLASHVTPEMVVVIGPEILAAGRPFEADEPARHKLLDLVGDLFLYGGPPRGSIRAYRPGHGSTHEAMRVAIERGVIARA